MAMQIFQKHSVTAKVNLIFIAFGFLLLLSFLLPAYWVGRNILEDNAKSELRAISVQKQLTLEGWLTYTESFIRGIANTSDLKNNLEAAFSTRNNSPEDQYVFNELIRDLRTWLQTDNGFETLSVINQQNGIVVASTLPSEIGVDASNEPYFINGKSGTYVQNPFISKYLQEPIIRISMPFQTPVSHKNFVLAVRIKLTKIVQIVQRGTNPNSSIDVYLINRSKQVVVPPRFRPQGAALQDTVNTPTIERCIQGENGDVAETDYRGIPVISSYTWLPNRELCLIVEKNRVEAFSDIRRFTWAVVLSTCAVFALGLLLSLFLSKIITDPICRLVTQVEKFGKGQLNDPIENYANDEIGLLSRAFSQMADNLSRSIKETQQTALENLRLYQETKDRALEIEAEKAFITKLLDISSNPIVVNDREGRIIQHNRALEVLTGYSAEELQGQIYSNVLRSPQGTFERVPSLEDLLSANFPNYVEEDFITKDGEKRQYSWSSDCSRDSSGRIEYIINIAVDITESKRIEERLRASERNFHTALAAAPISIYTTDRDLRITFMHDPTPNFCQEDYLGKRVDGFLPGETATAILSVQKAVLQTGKTQRGEIVAEVNGWQSYYAYYADPIRNPSGLVVGLACAGYDITEQKKTQQALVEIKNNLEQIVAERTRELNRSQKILQTTLDAFPEIAALVDRSGKLLFGNKILAERLNTPLNRLIGSQIFSFFSAEVAAVRKEKTAEAFATGQDVRFMDKNNERYYDNLFHPFQDEENRDLMLAVLATDVTEWIRAQDAIASGRERSKELARKVVIAQEEERQRISRELHDEAGQALTALSISLNLFYDDLPDTHGEVKKRISDAISLVTSTLDQIRVLAQDLRPQALDTLGLNNALEGYCREFSRRTKIEVQYQGTEISMLADIVGISLYRFLQEALTNAAKHSGAKLVNISLSLDQSVLTLKVQDYGIGFQFEPSSQNGNAPGDHGIGLLGMRERIEMIGGKMEINSTPGKGTLLVAMVNINGDPIERRNKNGSSSNRR